MNPDDGLLIGFDMIKDVATMEKAYNDSQGITAAFNKNILHSVNQLAHTNFDPGQFEHHACYNSAEGRIEMYLRALANIEVTSSRFDGSIFIKEDETIHTENSHKFDSAYIHHLAKSTGLQITDIYTDVNQWFSLVHFR